LPAQVTSNEPKLVEGHAARPSASRKPASSGKPPAARPHFSRPATQTRDRKPAQGASSSRPVRRGGDARPSASRPSAARPSGSRPAAGTRAAAGARWKANSPAGAKAGHNGTGHNEKGSHAAGNGASNGARPKSAGARTAKASTPGWGQRNGSANGAKSAGKPSSNGRSSAVPRNGNSARKDARPDARPSRNGSRKPTLAAGAKAGNSKRYGFTARPKQETKKRG